MGSPHSPCPCEPDPVPVIRFSNDEVLQDPAAVLEEIGRGLI